MRIDRVVTAPADQPEFQNNTWIVGNDAACIVIDPAHDAEASLSRIASRQVVAILITHGHWDHVQAATELADTTQAPVWMHPADRFLWDQSHPARQPNGSLTDGEIFTVDDSSPSSAAALEVRHTPGHTPGSCVFVLWPQRPGDGTPLAVFTGDTLFPGGPGATRWDYSSFPQIMSSIRERIMTLPTDTVINPGHGAGSTVAVEAPQLPEWEARGW